MSKPRKRGGRTTPKSGGVRGDYADSCIVCLRGTDTGLAFVGEAEWAMAGLVAMGVPEDQATVTVAHGLGSEPGMVPNGRVTVPMRVCRTCADRAGFPVGLALPGQTLPGIVQPLEDVDQ